jgi:hypothetical protein
MESLSPSTDAFSKARDERSTFLRVVLVLEEGDTRDDRVVVTFLAGAIRQSARAIRMS